MRFPRLILIVFCFIFFPIFVTFFSALTSSPSLATPSSFAGRATGLHALFSFNVPSSLFPPSAIISLTDDNSTFFLARPAAFGPLLPEKGLSGQLWVGSGFGERTAAGAEGELGCSDIPGWGEGETHHKQDKTMTTNPDSPIGKSVPAAGTEPATAQDSPQDSDPQRDPHDEGSPATNDGTDDHLHHPLPESRVVGAGAPKQHGDNRQTRQTAHADIQSLQESAEITGKVVLLSRGGCGFLEKVKWVQRRGGIALIVGDDTRGGSLVTMYARGDTSNVTIPALFTSHTTAQLLSSLIPSQTGEDLALEDGAGASRTRLTGHYAEKQRPPTTTTSTAITSPTSTPHVMPQESQAPTVHQPGVFHGLMSLFGLGNNHAGSVSENSRRPPSSGNINWISVDHFDDQEPPQDDVDYGHGRTSVADDRRRSETGSDAMDGDGFVIGVQDWRDPDLMSPRSSSIPSPSGIPESERTKLQSAADGSSRSVAATLKGGSITPGSGEYRTFERSTVDRATYVQDNQKPGSGKTGSSVQSRGWFARHFSWAKNREQDSSRSSTHNSRETRKLRERDAGATSHPQGMSTLEHEGLWITLTPTSMSTSPFFDTLLVLVVSPLLTLTIVYALLLLRSRIRRRRWRAPKSLVDRLPVRTYHTISSSSSPASSRRSASPGPVSPTSPLLGTKARSEIARASDNNASSNVETPLRKEPQSSSTLWRRKYTGRQVECVVCLEEYVDGQSRVMSLPCGHEFHAECITPWLTTRRRTCPICKGDVVRSMSQNKGTEQADEHDQHQLGSHQSASSAPVLITAISEDEMSDPERHAGSDTGLVEEHASSAPPPGWRNYAALSFSALSGDTIWHPNRNENDR
ncbi:PA and RING finger domain protein [Aspergillus affinis]|uniref:PA and RING finger domain protein n=1 Tax=Aspergillus affinis TaxID=1070780 RepID=UPI0022FEBCDA|nr:uncharacterized protein KD926_007275 [Aspergillus affinis]KAI9041164.1 hypothetical protein KD926_007275 [Aspergillus affinis]